MVNHLCLPSPPLASLPLENRASTSLSQPLTESQDPSVLTHSEQTRSTSPSLNFSVPMDIETMKLTMKEPWYQSARCITANKAFFHVTTIMECSLLDRLAELHYTGSYKIQVGFNGVMLKEGLQVEEIYVTLSGDFEASLEVDISSVLEPIFAPFLGIFYTQGKLYHMPLSDLPSTILLSKDARADAPQIGSS